MLQRGMLWKMRVIDRILTSVMHTEPLPSCRAPKLDGFRVTQRWPCVLFTVAFSIRGRVRPSVCPSVRPSVHRSVPCYFRRWKVCILGPSCAVYPALFNSNHFPNVLGLQWQRVWGTGHVFGLFGVSYQSTWYPYVGIHADPNARNDYHIVQQGRKKKLSFLFLLLLVKLLCTAHTQTHKHIPVDSLSTKRGVPSAVMMSRSDDERQAWHEVM